MKNVVISEDANIEQKDAGNRNYKDSIFRLIFK